MLLPCRGGGGGGGELARLNCAVTFSGGGFSPWHAGPTNSGRLQWRRQNKSST